jgi:pyridoxine 5-phosphate synthase
VDALTSNAGWDTIKNQDFLKEIIKKFQSEGIRTSIFIDPVLDQIEGAAATGTDRIELYTEAYAADYTRNREIAIAPYVAASERANELGLGINAGHDLNLDNIAYFAKRIPSLLEVSIGHALICESLYLGFENVIPMYLQRLSY